MDNIARLMEICKGMSAVELRLLLAFAVFLAQAQQKTEANT